MISDNQLGQYFQFVKGMQLEAVISEPSFILICILRQSNLHDNNKHCLFLSSEISKMLLATCFLLRLPRTSHIFGLGKYQASKRKKSLHVIVASCNAQWPSNVTIFEVTVDMSWVKKAGDQMFHVLTCTYYCCNIV